jgi:hypothetical protein
MSPLLARVAACLLVGAASPRGGARASAPPLATAPARVVSKLAAALGPQHFSLAVAAGSAALLRGPGGQHLTTLASSFSEPGPRWLNFSEAREARGWVVAVDRSHAAQGVWLVRGTGKSFRVERTYALDPLPPAQPRRVLVNDTISAIDVDGDGGGAPRYPPDMADVIGVHVRHTATVAASAAEVEQAVVAVGNRYSCGFINLYTAVY